MLKVWLPLNGTLENQGVSAYQAVGTDLTVDNSGKIGKCYSFNGTSSKITVANFSIGNNWSYGAWIYSPTSSRGWEGAIILNTNGGDADMQLGFYTYPTGNRIQSTANGQYNSGISMTYGQWNHLFATFDGSSLKTYINGTLVNTKAITNAQLVRANLTIGARCRGSSYDCFFSGKINDVRIYDHCLSAAEIREISQGLVLHYKLDGGINGNENFILASHKITSGGDASGITRTYMADDSLKVVAASGNGNWCSIGFAKNSNDNVGAKLAVGDTYTISCDVKVENGTTLPTVFINSGNSYKRLQGTIIQNQWIRAYYTSTWADPGTGYGNISLHLGFSGIVGTYYFKNFKLEKSSFPTVWSPAPADGGVNLTQIQDSSGYGHNGTITGTPVLNSNTPRYSSCINLTSGQKISVTGLLTSSNPIWTVNFWVKMYSNTYTAWADVITFKGNKSIRVEVSSSNGKNLAWYNYPLGTSNGIPISNINYDEWNMITMVWNGTSILSYFNGVLKYTATISGTAWTPNGEMTIGDTGMYMYMSDVRIYATALSADDILSLYHTAAKVDNLGGLHTFEFQEKNNLKIYKTGITEHKEMREAYMINTAYSYSYKPAANTNNSTTSGITVDFSAFTNETSPLSMTVDYDASWTNFSAGTGGTFSVYIQGNNRRVSDNAWAWEGSNYLTNKGGFTTLITANANGSTHVHYDTTIPTSWLSTYNASHMGMRTNYSDGNGTITISNIKITLTQNSCKIKNNYLQANTLIEK